MGKRANFRLAVRQGLDPVPAPSEIPIVDFDPYHTR